MPYSDDKSRSTSAASGVPHRGVILAALPPGDGAQTRTRTRADLREHRARQARRRRWAANPAGGYDGPDGAA